MEKKKKAVVFRLCNKINNGAGDDDFDNIILA